MTFRQSLTNKELKSTIDYNKIVYRDRSGNIKVRKELVNLLKLTVPQEVKLNFADDEEMLIKDFVTLTQAPSTAWMRKPDLSSRWHTADSISEEEKKREETILDTVRKLGLFEGVTLKENSYDAAVMLGSSTPSLAKRFFALQDILEKKKFKTLFLMSSKEDVSKYKDTLSVIYQKYPDRFKESVVFPETITEHEVLHFFVNNLKWPNDFTIKVKSCPSDIKIIPDGKKIKPNTNDELQTLKKYLKEHSDESLRKNRNIFSCPICS